MNESLLKFHPLWRSTGEENSPVLLLLHGTGGDEGQLVSVAREICGDRKVSILGIRGQVREGQANRFFRRLREGVFDEADLRFRANELADALAASTQEYGLESSRLFALGFSNGANMAAALFLLRPESLAGVVMLRPMFPLVPDTPPDLSGKNALLISGAHDPWGPMDSARRLAGCLKEYGAEVRHEILPAEHELTEQDIHLAGDWLRERLEVLGKS